MMKKRLLYTWIGSLFCLVCYAQRDSVWTEQDSLWLRDVLSGKIKVRLNDEVRRSIEAGTWIRPEGSFPEPATEPLPAAREWLITEDFSGAALRDSARRLPVESMATCVLTLYGMKAIGKPPVCDFRSFRIYSVGASGGPSGSGGAGVIFVFSAEDLLERIFWKSARAKRHNARHANAWRYYHTIP